MGRRACNLNPERVIGWRSALFACAAAVLLIATSACTDQPISLATFFLRPTADMDGSPADYGANYEELRLPVADGRAVSIWHIKADNPKAVVVVIPGSDRNKSRYLPGVPIFAPSGYDLILMDYEGFGASTDAPLELERLLDDGFAVVDFARTLHPKVVAFGISIGAATTVRIAAERDLAGVILEAPPILHDEVELWLRSNGVDRPALWNIANAAVWPQIPDDFDILKYIQRVGVPKLIMQSVEDDVVPFASGWRVYQAAPDPKQFFEMRGRHGKMVQLDPELYKQTIISWLDAVIGTE